MLKMYHRYLVITYDRLDGGADEKSGYHTIKDAIRAIKDHYLKNYESAFIYDLDQRSVRHAFGRTPDGIFSADTITRNCIYHF